MERLKNIHPGEILKIEFLEAMSISAYRLAKETFIPQTRIGLILAGKRRISVDTALRFAKFFGNSAQFWIQLQIDYDIELENEIQKDTTPSCILQPLAAAEEIQGAEGGQGHQSDGKGEAIFPLESIDELEVHAINTRDQCWGHENHRGNRKDFNDFVLFDVNQTQKGVLQILQTLKVEIGVIDQ